tara:strand:+ start:428 stop:724 length:297 start_codon:yes stop_codon:yes gene_type:complete
VDLGEWGYPIYELSVHEDEQALAGFQFDASTDREQELAHREFFAREEFVLVDLGQLTSTTAFDDDRDAVWVLVLNLLKLCSTTPRRKGLFEIGGGHYV